MSTRPWRRSFPDVGGAVLLMGALLAIQIGCGIVIGVAMVVTRSLGKAATGTEPIPPAALLATNLLAFAVTLGWASWANRGRNREMWRSGRSGWAGWVAALAAVPGLMIVVVTLANPLVALLRLIPGYDPTRDPLGGLLDFERHPFVSVAMVVVLAPVAEEILFRGYILRGLAERLRPGAALWLSTLLFVVAHANPVQVPVGLALGLVCGWIFLRTRSLALCIVVHLANNALALFGGKLPFAIAGFNAAPESGAAHPWWFESAGFAALALALGAFGWASRDRIAPPPLPAGPAEPPVLPPVATATRSVVLEH